MPPEPPPPPPRTPRPGVHFAARRVLALLLAALAGHGCVPSEPLQVRVERDLLLRERDALRREMASVRRAEGDTATGAGAPAGAVVVIPSALVQRLLELALPVEVTMGGLRVTATGVRLDFRGGLARVRLAARVARVGAADVSADMEVVGALQVIGTEPTSGTLTSRVEILGLETRNVRVGGLSPPVERLMDELARRPAADLNRLLERVEIPVRLAESVPMPRVEEEELTLDAAELPLRFRVRDVAVAPTRLWVFLDVAVGE